MNIVFWFIVFLLLLYIHHVHVSGCPQQHARKIQLNLSCKWWQADGSMYMSVYKFALCHCIMFDTRKPECKRENKRKRECVRERQKEREREGKLLKKEYVQ